MTSGSIACFVSNKAIDNKARELTVNVNGTAHSETILLDSAADINAPVKAKVSLTKAIMHSIFVIRKRVLTEIFPLIAKPLIFLRIKLRNPVKTNRLIFKS